MERDGATIWTSFSGLNAAYLQELYDRYRSDPESVEATVRELFERWGPPRAAAAAAVAPAAVAELDETRIAGAVGLARAIRAHGHRAARLDPLGSEPPGDPELRAESHGIREEDLAALAAAIVGGASVDESSSALAAIDALRGVYQASTGYEFEHLGSAEERAWLYEMVESRRFCPPGDALDERALLERLTEVGAFERFLHRVYPGQIRFSIEGLGMLIPMLDEIIGAAAEAGTRAVMLGMAHRGRLNVLAHVLGKPYDQILAEFQGTYRQPGVSPSGSSGLGWTGDVKYHLGARRAYRGGQQVDMLVALAPNPSHLEHVNPVVQGMARAACERRDRPGPPERDDLAALVVLVHGDASFPGQGIVAETLNLSNVPGYRTGGTIHLIANNQLGFTTSPELARPTLYASDLAKGFDIPAIHVNADVPEACIVAVRLAHAYRERFHKDVVVDLIGYRRWGHNEGDEPSFTQPRMYARIARHPTVRELWAQEMVRRGVAGMQEVEALLQEAIERLHGIRRSLPESGPGGKGRARAGLEAGGPSGGLGDPGPAVEVGTAVAADELERLNEHLQAVPAGFNLHPKLERPFARRRAAAAEGGPIDWAHAEALAFATILADGTPVRLTGEDTARGTFSQRHLVLHDAETGRTHTPLQALPGAGASFEVWDSTLSEQAVLAFEYGYSVQAPDALVIWEAQYGDFINVGQAIVDEFIVSGKSKWGQRSGMVLLLPHGYEGQGPDHSSGRLERFLQLAAEDNLRVANCTTAAQYFHLLRRQARLLGQDPRPLVVMTPKGLLRHRMAASSLSDLAEGRFRPILADPGSRENPEVVRRLVLCSGKVYVDLAASGRLVGSGPEACEAVMVGRVEELYPFPADEVAELMAACPELEEVVWLQEEPRNMGAWTYVAPRLRDILAGRLPLIYVGRPRRASPAEGAHEWHVEEQKRIVEAAFEVRGLEG